MQRTMTIGQGVGRNRKRNRQTHTDKIQNAWPKIETSLPSVKKDIHEHFMVIAVLNYK